MHRNCFGPLLVCFALVAGCEIPQPNAIPGTSEPMAPSADGQSGPLRVYFTSPEKPPADTNNPAQILADYIGKTEKTLDVAAYELDNRVIADALVAAQKRGVKVRLVTETNNVEESGVIALRAAGVPVVDDQRDGPLMHNKFIVFDNRSVWTGSMNFTENCAYKNNNHGVYVDDAKIAGNYAAKFSWMFDYRKFGGLPARGYRIPNPSVTLANGISVENYFSTHDHVADHVIEKLARAKKSIHFLAFDFTHDEIARTMLARAAQGVEVKGVFERRQAVSPYSEFENLRRAGYGVEVHLDANKYTMHHKVIIIDGELILCGSFNFSNNADKVNDENVLFIQSKETAERFEAEFQRVFGAARSASEAAGRR